MSGLSSTMRLSVAKGETHRNLQLRVLPLHWPARLERIGLPLWTPISLIREDTGAPGCRTFRSIRFRQVKHGVRGELGRGAKRCAAGSGQPRLCPQPTISPAPPSQPKTRQQPPELLSQQIFEGVGNDLKRCQTATAKVTPKVQLNGNEDFYLWPPAL